MSAGKHLALNLLLLSLVGAGCAWRVPKSPPRDLQHTLQAAMEVADPAERNRTLMEALHARVLEFQTLVESNHAVRENILREANRLERAFAAQRTLSPADLKLVSEGAGKYLRLRDDFFRLVNRYDHLFDYTEEELIAHQVDPRVRLVAVMVSVGAALTLYDNYLTTVVRFEESAALRRYINDGDSATGMNRKALEEIGQSARSLVNRGQLRVVLRTVETWRKQYDEWGCRFAAITGDLTVLDEDYRYLETLLESSLSYRAISEVRPVGVTENKLTSLFERTAPDLVRESGESLLRLLSEVFVRAIAVVEPRQGLLYANPARRVETLATLARTLKAGDILLEKSGFRLTDLVVPGHFGHSGIWLGTDEELTALGVWDEPRIQRLPRESRERLRATIRQGRAVVEALREGVVLNTVEHFINVDDLALLRPRMNEDPARRAETLDALVTAMTHLGKSYDFGFDVHSRARLVCSELSFQSYTQAEFHWPKTRTLGRYTITPDEVAQRAFPLPGEAAAPLRVILLFQRGHRVPGEESVLREQLGELITGTSRPD
jgi:hypothetical protein